MKTFLMQGRKQIQKQEAQRTPNTFNRSRSTPGHIVIKKQNVVKKDNFNSRKTKDDSYLQGKHHKVITGFFQKKLLNQKWVAWYLNGAEWKTSAAKEIRLSSALSFRWKERSRVSQIKTKGIHNQQTTPASNVKGDSLSGKETPKVTVLKCETQKQWKWEFL